MAAQYTCKFCGAVTHYTTNIEGDEWCQRCVENIVVGMRAQVERHGNEINRLKAQVERRDNHIERLLQAVRAHQTEVVCLGASTEMDRDLWMAVFPDEEEP